MPIKDYKMPRAVGHDDRSLRYRSARRWLISAAVDTLLDHCSEADRDRLNLIAAPEVQDPDAMILEFNEETNQHVDLVVQQAIATISILISKTYNITVLKQDI